MCLHLVTLGSLYTCMMMRISACPNGTPVLDFLFCMGVPVAVYQNLLVSLSLPCKFMKQLIFQLSTGCFTEIKPIFMVALKISQFFTHKNQFQTPNAQFTVYAI